MIKYFVGGYYDDRIFKDAEGKTPFRKDVSIYDLESALKLGFIEPIEEWYKDIKDEEEPEWDELGDSKKAELVLEYSESDEIAGLVGFETLKKAVEYLKNTLSEILEFEGTYEYVEKIQDQYGYYRDVYERKEVN